MFSLFRSLFHSLPTFLLALLLAATVWIVAVSEADPIQQLTYSNPVPIEIVGQDPSLIVTSTTPEQISLVLSAPQSIWQQMTRENVEVRAVADFSGLGAGKQTVPIQVRVGIRPVKIISFTPASLEVMLESVSNRSFSIHLVERGEPAVGFQADKPHLSQSSATVTGPDSLVNQVKEVLAVLDITRANENLERTITLKPVDASGVEVKGLTLNPAQVTVSQKIIQRGGYRNVVVKVALQGQIAPGYRITNISVFPPVVTAFSSDPSLVDALPGYVETAALDLTGAKDDMDTHLKLNLPAGVSAVDADDVEVLVGIASIDGSLTLQKIPVEVTGAAPGLTAQCSPGMVDIIISGPLALLDTVRLENIHVVVDVEGQGIGTITRTPRVELGVDGLLVQSVLPPSLEVVISSTSAKTATATPTLTPTPTPQPK